MFRSYGELAAPAISAYGPVFRRWFHREFCARHLWGLVAETSAGVPVATGLLWLQPRQPSPRFPHQRTPYILSVYTDPAHRRHGLGSQIVAALVASARRRGYTRVELHSTEIGRPIYEKVGFTPTNQMRLDFRLAESSAGSAPTPPRGRGPKTP
ncbi:MAG: GNAT family N-acetyltransferase [Thermoplasmata archaeon]